MSSKTSCKTPYIIIVVLTLVLLLLLFLIYVLKRSADLGISVLKSVYNSLYDTLSDKRAASPRYSLKTKSSIASVAKNVQDIAIKLIDTTGCIGGVYSSLSDEDKNKIKEFGNCFDTLS